jgi:hypothetical protein
MSREKVFAYAEEFVSMAPGLVEEGFLKKEMAELAENYVRRQARE